MLKCGSNLFICKQFANWNSNTNDSGQPLHNYFICRQFILPELKKECGRDPIRLALC